MVNLGYNRQMPATLPPGIAMRPFTEALFQCMTALIPQMSQDDQDKIRAYLCAPKEHPISGLMSRMIESSPILAKEFEDQPFDELRLTLGPLLVWGLTQEWADQCDVPGCLSAWSERLTGMTHKPNTSAAILGLGIVPLLSMDSIRLDVPAKERLNGDVYRAMQALVPWNETSSNNDHVLAPLLVLALAAPEQKMGHKRLPSDWSQCMRQTISTLSVLDQKYCIASLAANGLSRIHLLSAFKAADPLVWLMPEFRDSIMSVLPKTENARSKELPWTPNTWQPPVGQRIRPGEVNRQLHEQYCPLLYLGLSMIVKGTNDWEDRTYIKMFVADFNKSAQCEALTLPEGLLADEAPQ